MLDGSNHPCFGALRFGVVVELRNGGEHVRRQLADGIVRRSAQ
jgi:hypothetical protein